MKNVVINSFNNANTNNNECYDVNKLSFAERLSLLRKISNKKQIEIAQEIGCSDKTLSKWENGETEPSMSELSKLSTIYNVSLDFLMLGKVVSKEDAKTNKRVCDKKSTTNLEDELNELLKPYGRFTSEDKSKLFKISAAEILVDIDSLVERGDIDLYHKLNETYRFIKTYKCPNNSDRSILDCNPQDKIYDKPYKLTFQDCLYTNKLDFYKEALKVFEEEVEAHERNNEQLKKFGYANYNKMAGMAPNKEQVLSDALSGVLAKFPDANDVLLYLLENGAYIQVKVPWEYTEGYHIERDEAQTNLLKKMLKK